MAGDNEQKLREHLSSSRVWQVFTAEHQWSLGERALKRVADAIENARPLAERNLGRHTADQADRAFAAMHAKVKERQEQLKKGAEALGEAKAAISRAEAVVRGFDADGPINEPTPPDWSDDEIDQIRQLKVHGAKVTAYNNAVAEREQAALAAIQDVDATNQASTATMREIQGKRPEDAGGGGGGGTPGGGGGGVPPGTGGTPPRYDPPTYDPPTNPTFDPPTGNPTHDPPTFDPPTGGTSDPPTGGTVDPPTGETGPGEPPVLTTPPSGTFGGMAGAIGGGLAGGAIGMGAIRAGALGGAGSTSASGARPIGSTGRTAASGALGRGAVAGGTPTRAAAGRAAAAGAGAAGRGAAGRGAAGRGAGARGAAGGRGAAGRGAGAVGAGGRGGRQGKDDQSAEVDHLLDDHDWIDDEDAAPGVID
jgi:hypothetical protein